MAISGWLGFGRSSSKSVVPIGLLDELREMRELVSHDMLTALAETGEIAGGLRYCPAEVERLLMRFLIAEKGDSLKAAHRLEKHVAWRGQALPRGLIGDDEVTAHLASGKALFQPPSAGGGRRGVLVVRARLHLPAATPSSERFVLYCLECAARWARLQEDDGKVWVLFDLSGLAIRNLDAGALRASFRLLAEHYPERLAGCFMLEAPAIFSGLWKMVSPFIDVDTRKKIRFLSGPSALQELTEALGEASLPPEYGGTAQAVPVQEAARLWDAQQQNGVEEAPLTAGAAASTEGSALPPAPDAPGLEGNPSPQT